MVYRKRHYFFAESDFECHSIRLCFITKQTLIHQHTLTCDNFFSHLPDLSKKAILVQTKWANIQIKKNRRTG